ncbi:MAG: hypothetical protein KDI31_10320 [Pseudomonadales bacterium]|nr:hypothetical protein [Pseudomonadales bacterium]
MNDAARGQSGGLVPLVVGVTGHRDLPVEEQALIKSRIREFFLELRRDYPELPLLVMTPLAEGADRIAAVVAHELGIPISILLPMPLALYERDFTGDSLVEFKEMLTLGERVELPLLEGTDRVAVAGSGRVRDLQYAQLGAYLAAHSHILLAIWDGKPSTSPGGTGHVVKFHQHDVIELIAEGQHRSPIDFTEDESDLVYHVVCSRREGGPPDTGLAPGDVFWLTRDELKPRTLYMPPRYRLVFQRMAEFSADLRRPADERVFYELLPADALTQCPPGARDIDDLYHRADALARRYQQHFYMALRSTSVFALLAGCCFVLYADLGQDLLIYPYIFSLALVLVLSWLDRRFAWRRRFQDYRVLAEGLRVQFYWSVAGVVMENPSRFSHDSFLRRQDLELGWIRNVMRFAGRRADSVEHETSSEAIELVSRRWVEDQRDYYSTKAQQLVSRSRFTGAIGLISFGVVLAAGILLAFAADRMSDGTGDLLIALMGLFPFVFAVRQNYALRQAERELVAQYQHNRRIFSNAARLLQAASSLAAQQEILRALGEAALEENGQWILRQRRRPATVSESAGLG